MSDHTCTIVGEFVGIRLDPPPEFMAKAYSVARELFGAPVSPAELDEGRRLVAGFDLATDAEGNPLWMHQCGWTAPVDDPPGYCEDCGATETGWCQLYVMADVHTATDPTPTADPARLDLDEIEREYLRQWTDTDWELVRAVLHEADYYDNEAARAVLDALAAAGRIADPQELERLRARVAELEAEAVQFSARLGFGDNVSDGATPLLDMLDPIAEAMEAARDHDECPTHCEGCGETLAAKLCPRCNGGGDIGTTAYEECGECAGAGRIHEGCAEASYADLAAQAAKLDAEATKWKTRLVDETAQLLADLNAARARVAYLEQEVTEEASSAAALRQTLDATRQQLRDEAESIMRRPAHPPVAADIAWQLRRIAECPVCSGPSRETTDMVCQSCGKDWGPGPATKPGFWLDENRQWQPLSATPPETACGNCGGSGTAQHPTMPVTTCEDCKGDGRDGPPVSATPDLMAALRASLERIVDHCLGCNGPLIERDGRRVHQANGERACPSPVTAGGGQDG